MSSENNPNANASATTSTTAPEKTPADLAAEREKTSEADYITREQDSAKAAIGGVIGDMKRAVAQAGDVKEWTRLHPWVMVGGAAAVGLAAGLMLIPSKSSSKRKNDPMAEFFGEHWDEVKAKLNGLTPAGAAAAAAAATAATSATAAQQQAAVEAKPSMLGGLISEVLKIVGPTLGGLVTGAIAGHQEGEKPPEGNGHQPPQQPVGYRAEDPRDQA